MFGLICLNFFEKFNIPIEVDLVIFSTCLYLKEPYFMKFLKPSLVIFLIEDHFFLNEIQLQL